MNKKEKILDTFLPTTAGNRPCTTWKLQNKKACLSPAAVISTADISLISNSGAIMRCGAMKGLQMK